MSEHGYNWRQEFEDHKNLIGEWAECPECGSGDIQIVVYHYDMGDGAELECEQCGASTADLHDGG